jgi:hypothetical protein
MGKWHLLYEAPIGDYLPDEYKNRAKANAKRLYDDPTNPAPSSNEVGMLMMRLPGAERGKQSQLVALALETFYKMYPRIKNLVDKGKIKMDAALSTSPGGRSKSQSIPTSKIEKAKESDPSFDERVKQRNFINARTQAKAWIDGFGAIKNMEEKIKSIDPSLFKPYMDFVKGASRFYWENTEMLERMASQGSGRVAYCDVYPDKSERGVYVFEARAPHLPLLMHELVKGAEYYDSLFSLPKEKELGDTLMGVTDTHKHEIQNMNYGRELWSKIRFFLEEYVDGYDRSMESDLAFELDALDPKEFNRFMDGIVTDNNKSISDFIKVCEEIVKDL